MPVRRTALSAAIFFALCSAWVTAQPTPKTDPKAKSADLQTKAADPKPGDSKSKTTDPKSKTTDPKSKSNPDPKAGSKTDPKTEPKKQPPEPLPGDAMIRSYFQRQAKEIGQAGPQEYKTKEDWLKARPALHRELLDMLGLWPLPPRTDLKPVITGKFETAKYTVEKVTFQSRPNLHVTGNLYVPKPAPTKAPTVLYVCGHGNVVKDGVSFGSKVHYQHHPAWFASNGYVALVIDTLQLSEIPGIHHGTHRFGMWWWHSRGYTPAGVECWNAMRALDYLQTRPEVDPDRIGVTGRSGGGAYSWWIAATDERIKCAIPVAGIADLHAHLNEGYPGRLEKGVIAGHCDCMFWVNTYRWDFWKLAAMIAPRPLLLGNSDVDDIFPVPGYRRLAEKTRGIYELMGAGDKFALLETKGKHEDTPELRSGAFRWMNKHLKNDLRPVVEEKHDRFPPEQLKVLTTVPEGALNALIQETFIKPGEIERPRSKDVVRPWWPEQKLRMEGILRDQVFRGWPTKTAALDVKSGGRVVADGVVLQAWDYTSEEGIPLRIWVQSADGSAVKSVILSVVDEAGFAQWTEQLGPAFADLLKVKSVPKRNDAMFAQNKAVMAKEGWAFAAIAPRGIGPTKWAEPGSADDVQMRRRFALVGQTLDGMRVWDTRRAIQALRTIPTLKEVPVRMQARGEIGGVALFAAIYESTVESIDLWHPTVADASAPAFLNLRRHFDIAQASALMAGRKVTIHAADAATAAEWTWPLELQQALGGNWFTVKVVGK